MSDPCRCGCQTLVEQPNPLRGRPRLYLPGHAPSTKTIVTNADVICRCGCKRVVEQDLPLKGRPRSYLAGHRRPDGAEPDPFPWKAEIVCHCGCGVSFSENTPRIGRPRRYLPGHSKRAASRNYKRRRRAGEAQNLDHNKRCHRYKPTDTKQANKAWEKHIAYGQIGNMHCSLASSRTSNRCPAPFYKDYNCEQRLCVVYATLTDDLMLLKTGGQYVRRFTTEDGEWLSAAEAAEAVLPTPETVNEWDDPDAHRW